MVGLCAMVIIIRLIYKIDLLLIKKRGNINNEISVVESYKYFFDEKSEWIERKCYHKGKLFEIAERKIEEQN